MCKILLAFLLLSNFLSAQTFVKTQIVSDLHFAIAFDLAPDGRIFTTQKGEWAPQAVDAQINVYDSNGTFLSEFYDLSDSVHASGEYGLLGITLDPNFGQNHFVYVFYTWSDNPANGGDIHLRVQRFTESFNTGTQPVVLLDIDVLDNQSRNHVAGNLHFRPSDSTHLYISVGDMRTDTFGWPAQLNYPYGKILRISKYPGAPAPANNPFYDDGNPLTGNNDYIWAYGLRNSFDFCFGSNDSLYATENGTTMYDEVNLITKGGFYGWPECEGFVDLDTTSLPCHAVNKIDPMVVFPVPIPALTGILFYTDTTWGIHQNHLITSDCNHADLTAIYLSNAPAYNVADSAVFWIDESNINCALMIRQAPNGCIYVMEFADTIFGGGIYSICPVGNTIPETPSEWSFNVGPNPFHTSTTILYSLAESCDVSLKLYDTCGKEIAVLVDDSQTSGNHSVEIDAQKYSLSAGIYACLLQSEQFSRSVKLIVQ